MADIGKIATEEIERITAELNQVTEEINVLSAKQQDLTADLESWRHIRARYDKHAEASPSEQEQKTANVVTAALETVPTAAPKAEGNSTDFIRAFLRKWAQRGVTMRDIKTAVDAAKLDVGPTFAYTAVSKMKSRGEIDRRNGRYYPTEKLQDNRTLSLLAPQVM